MYIPNTKWTWSFLLVALVQAIVALALEAYVFGRFQTSLRLKGQNKDAHNEPRTIPTYLAVFMFGYLYQLVLVYDALRLKNTIQVIGLVLYNVGILIYAAIQLDQIRDAVTALDSNQLIVHHFWPQVKPMLIALPCLMGLGTVIFAFLAWKLYDEFAWTIYKHISADLRLKRRYLTYQIYIALLKFDFFFFLGFTVQFLVVVQNTTDVEFGLTIAVLFVTFILLLLAAFWVRRENIAGMIVIILVYFCALAYFLFKLIRMYAADRARIEDYKPARKSLTSFAVITILLLLATIVIACMCTHNFNKGLKPHIQTRKPGGGERGGKAYNTEMPSLSGPQPARMEID
ncbi:uncharacterized protein BDR25DRAFT_28753 [Lindgomyces ingoldianus]|uniref:Uncharacterized protein n=1 Tax=Lindgomyces ingoldianus TaxID=673940 RepID=A0ACB6QVE6_9PLEO|nr:uncharacterized protein BDR25DRAFT_28753 [Lindgomyces ingoldianus]KAF2470984.1 hypothetical protein BDR25DRAFT_28753 [Lindgomyces ingoldianus]